MFFFFFKQKTAYEMRISDWSSDVCSSDLVGEYKSAVEPFTRNDMSPDARAADIEWLGDLWNDYGAGVGKGRKLPENTADIYVRQFASGLTANGGDAAAYAKTSGLVTSVETLDRKSVG